MHGTCETVGKHEIVIENEAAKSKPSGQLKVDQMPTVRKELWKRLAEMSEDIQIGGDVNFRAMSLALVGGDVSEKTKRNMEKLLSRARKLLIKLDLFWTENPDAAELVDRAEVCASEKGKPL